MGVATRPHDVSNERVATDQEVDKEAHKSTSCLRELRAEDAYVIELGHRCLYSYFVTDSRWLNGPYNDVQ